MKKQLKVSMIVVLFLLLGGVVTAEEIRLRVIAENPSIRLKPSSDSVEVYKPKPGIILTSEKKVGEWYLVNVQTEEGNYTLAGYIHELQVEVLSTVTETERLEPTKKVETTYQPPVPTPRVKSKHNFYSKLILGFGPGFSKILVGVLTTGDNTTNKYIYPGGGIALELDFGYRLPNNLKIEIGIGYLNSGVKAANATIGFQRMPLKLSLLYEFRSRKKLKIYTGAGPVYFLGPKFNWEENGSDYINYDPVFGMHALVGATTHDPSKPLFFFFEARYMGTFSKYKMNSSSFYPIYALRQMSGQGIFFNFGIGYYF